MQNRYAGDIGDIGDFGKFGLLKFIGNENLKVGVNWYLTIPVDEKEQKRNDGKHKIKEKYSVCDEKIYNVLTEVFNLDSKRSIQEIEKRKPIKNVVYYSKQIDIDNRDKWHNDALKKLKNCDVVFLDPDNGLEVESAKNSKKKLSKYVLMKEIKSYLDNGKSVVFYNHRPRRNEKEHFDDLFDKVKKATKVTPFSISFHKGTVRDYIILPKSQHRKALEDARKKMLESKWVEVGLCKVN